MSRQTEGAPDPLGYLAACYRADNQSGAVTDLLDEGVAHRHFPTGVEVLASGLQAGLAVPTEIGEKAMKAAATYRREKQLLYGLVIAAGRRPRRDGGTFRLCAPVVYYPAALRRSEVAGTPAYVLEIESEDARVNVSLFAELAAGDDEALDRMLARVPEPPFDASAISELMHVIRDAEPAASVEPLYGFPELLTEREVRAASRGETLRLLPAAAMALVENPRGSRGVLFELSQESIRLEPSAPIRAVLGEAAPFAPTPAGDDARVPAVLSKAQEKIVRSARRNVLSLVVGPPGTGKTYTVAAVAVDHIVRGESVLVACRTERALDAIEDKLRSMLGETTALIRGGSRGRRRELKSFLRAVLSGALSGSPKPASRQLARDLEKVDERHARESQRLTRRTELEQEWGALRASQDSLGLWSRLRFAYLELRLARGKRLLEIHERLSELSEQRVALAAEHLRAVRRERIDALLATRRRDLKRLLDALRARTSSRQERLFGETALGPVLDAFPLWMSTFRDLHRLAPFERELFDLVIVDEATQSDMASSFPALHRGRRAVVTGDPKQLRHVSVLARAQQHALAREHRLDAELAEALDYRDKSLLDLVDGALGSQEQVAFLNEHFRSMPQIIDFSNREIYGGALAVMTSRPETLRTQAVTLRRIEGRREPSGINEPEAEAVLRELERRIEAARSSPPTRAPSFGVLSPFRNQVEHLAELITKRLALDDIEKHDLLVGTAYGFQGDERDVMLLSLVVDDESHPMSFRYLGRPDVFNVSITRARDHQVVFTSLTPGALPADSLAGRYLRRLESWRPGEGEGESGPPHDFLDAARRRLEKRGLRLWSRYPVAGSLVDLVVERDGRVLGLDLIGRPDSVGAALELERYRMFARAGLALVPLPLADFERDPDSCLDAIEERLQRVARHGRRP